MDTIWEPPTKNERTLKGNSSTCLMTLLLTTDIRFKAPEFYHYIMQETHELVSSGFLNGCEFNPRFSCGGSMGYMNIGADTEYALSKES